MSFQRELASYNARARALYKLILETDLVNAVNGGTFDVALGFLPPGTILNASGAMFKLNTQFTGGAASAVGVTVGTAAGPTLVATSFDAFGATASGLYVRGTGGAEVVVPAGGQQIIARFTPDGAHNLTALTAGSLEILVPFHLPSLQ